MLEFVKITPEELKAQVVREVEKRIGEPLYPGDERMLFIENLLPVLVGQIQYLNFTGSMNFTQFALGEFLDAIGEDRDVIRLQPQTAVTVLEFVKVDSADSVDRQRAVTIPKGALVTSDGRRFFATASPLSIPAGEERGRVEGRAAEPGSLYNGIYPGQINSMVTAVPGIASVSNLETTAGGTDLETDADYGLRIRLSMEAYSNAGSRGAYEYWCRTASAEVEHVLVTSPLPGQVKIYLLMKDGRLPERAEREQVLSVLSEDKVRPLTDRVEVLSPTVKPYDISLTYYIQQKEIGSREEIVKRADQAVQDYVLWQKLQLGRSINPDELRRRLLEAGVYWMDLKSPAFTDILDSEVAVARKIEVSYGGTLA